MTLAQMMEGPTANVVWLPKDKLTYTSLRQVGWLVAGGPHDGEFVPWPESPREKFNGEPIGSYSPVYIEIGD